MKSIIAGVIMASMLLGCDNSQSENASQRNRGQAIELARGGRTAYTIVYKFSGDQLLDPAVRDLADTLKEITGAEFPIKDEAPGPCIYIGKTAPGDTEAFKSRERRIRSVGKDLYIYGDYRYGTAGAIYNFLFEFCNCRWYTATGDNRIPKQDVLKFSAIDYRHEPSFKSLEHGSRWKPAGGTQDIRDWVRRNNSFLMPNYSFGEPNDAWTYIGPVTHTLSAYMPPIKRKPRSFNADNTFFAGPHPVFADKEYFKTNPEYFTLNKDGKRVPDRQLCFTNPTVRKLLLENIEKVIQAENYDPAKDGILDFSQNDRVGGFCFCPECQKLNEKYKTPGGAYFDFLVEMGNHFKKKYPKLMFRFFAYKEDMTGIPPTGLKFPDNMSVIIAPLEQDFSKSLGHHYNSRFLKQMREWSKLCREIWLWNYPTLYTFGMQIYSLFPGVYRNTENLKLAHDARVRYLIAEQGGSVVHGCSFKELNAYLQDRMAENVNIDVDATIKEFCDAVYGKAADDMIRYLREADEACKKDPGFFRYFNDPRVMRRVVHSPANLIKWQRAFDAMEAKVKNSKKALFNVRRARLNLDAVTLLCYPACAKFDAKFAEELPLEKLYRRYCKYVRDDAKVEFANHQPEAEREALITGQANSFILPARMAYEFHRREQKYPQYLIDKYGKENLHVLMPCPSRRPPDHWDEKSACGFVVLIPADNNNKYVVQHIDVGLRNRMPWNEVKYEKLPHKAWNEKTLARIKKNPKNFTLVYIGRTTLTVSDIMQFATLPNKTAVVGRDARFFLGECFEPANPKQKFDLYISVKPAPKGNMYLERMFVARVTESTREPGAAKK